MKTPEGQEARRKGGRILGETKTRIGVPNGWTRAQVDQARANARPEAKKIARKIMAQNDEQDPRAEEALTELATLVRSNTIPNSEKISAARTVLEFTKTKPAQEKNVNMYHKAEQLLDDVAEEIEEADYEELPAPSEDELDGTVGTSKEST